MKFVRISSTQVINLDMVTRIEMSDTEDFLSMTLFFDSGESYRCTEEESEVLLGIVKPYINEA